MLTKNIWEKQENCVIKYSKSLSAGNSSLRRSIVSYFCFKNARKLVCRFYLFICQQAKHQHWRNQTIFCFSHYSKKIRKEILFAMTYILFRYCFLFPSSYFHPKPQWILNHGPWMVVFIKINQGSFILLFLSLSRKEGNLEVLQKHTKAFILLSTFQAFPLPHSPNSINWQVPLIFTPEYLFNLPRLPYP